MPAMWRGTHGLPRWVGALLCLTALQAPGCWCEPPEPEKFNSFPSHQALTPFEYCQQRASVECPFAKQCQPAVYEALGGDSGCTEGMAARCQVQRASWMAAVSAGRAHFDSILARGCLDALSSRGCGDVEPVACGQVFRGRVVSGEPCVQDLECAPGLFCSGGPESCGLCVPAYPEDGPCWGPSSCQTGLRCQDGRCRQGLATGGVCGGDQSLCPPGTVCAGPYPPLAVCTVPVQEGASCATVPCAAGLSCVTAASGGPTCRRLAKEGEACDVQSRSAPPCEAPGERLYCSSVERVCKPVAVVGPGQSCGLSSICRADSRCQSGSCVARPRVGQPCTPSPTEEPCFEAWCVDGTCAALAKVGDSCQQGCVGLQCVGERCGLGPCDAGVAWDAWVPPPPDGGLDAGTGGAG